MKALLITLCLLLTSAGLSAREQADSVMPLREVVVTGTSAELESNLLPYTVSVIGDNQLLSSGKTNVLSAVSGLVPSLFVSERSIIGFGVSNGGSGHIKLRGVGGDRASAVLMMVDGQPQFAGIYSHHVADFYNKTSVKRVEVLPGPGSVLYGSNAMAGAINIITPQAESDGVRTTLTSQYGSYNTWLSSVSNSVRAGKFHSFVSASYNRTDGNIKNFDYKEVSAYAKAGWDFSPLWKLYADYTFMNFRGSDPIYPILSNPESTDIYRQNITRGEASATVSNHYRYLHGYTRIFYSYGNHFVDDPRHFHSTDDRLGVTMLQNFSPWRNAMASVGFDFDLYSGRIPISGGQEHTPGSLTTMESKRITEYSPYITLIQTFASHLLSISGGLRMANSDKFGTQWVPQFGFALNPGKGFNIKGNLAMGFRNPSFRELYLYKMANPDLSPEKMMNYELSVQKGLGSFLILNLTAYYSRGSNMIQTVDMKNQNTGRFINKGVELTARIQPLSNLNLYANYSYLHTSLSNLTGAPRQQYGISADYQPTKRLNLAAELKGVEGLYVADDIHLQTYAVVNLKVTYDLFRFLSLFCRFDNLTDARYEINRGYVMPGFTAMGGFTLDL